MTESIFNRTFTYRQRVNSTPLENFLTEIFSFCLKNDSEFLHTFFKTFFGFKSPIQNLEIETQVNYTNGRPDIELKFEKSIIFFECKVECRKRDGQLINYAKILANEPKKYITKTIIFLTKYFEKEEINVDNVKLYHIRWHEIYDLINSNHKEITQQLKLFLKENNMSKPNNFELQDLICLNTIYSTMTKMDSVLEEIEVTFSEQFGGCAKTQTLEGVYEICSTFKFEKLDYYLSCGFWWEENDPIPSFGLYLSLPKKKFTGSDLIEILNKELSGWNIDKSYIGYYQKRPLSDFMTMEKDNLVTMKEFIESHLSSILELKSKNSLLFVS